MISIVVVNWNSGAYLRACFRSIVEQTSRNWELIVVDNGSTNESVDLLREFSESGVITKCIWLESNVGFAEGMNTGFAQATGDVIIALNSDAFLAPDVVAAIEARGHDAAGHSSRIGMFAIPLYDWEQGAEGDVFTERIQVKGVALMRRMTVAQWDGAAQRRDQLLGPSGAAAIFTREAVSAALTCSGHVFDPVYFAYVEDIDLYIRLRSLGFECETINDTRIWHIGSASVGQNFRLRSKPMRFRGMSHMNRWRTWGKLGHRGMRWTMLPWMVVEDILRVVAGPDRMELIRAYFSNYRMFRSPPRRRYPPVSIPFGGTMYSRSAWKAIRTRAAAGSRAARAGTSEVP